MIIPVIESMSKAPVDIANRRLLEFAYPTTFNYYTTSPSADHQSGGLNVA